MKRVAAHVGLLICASATLLGSSAATRAAPTHYWCVVHQPPEYTWKKDPIPAPRTQLYIDPEAKTLRYENTWGVQQFKDGTGHDTDDPHVGLVDHIDFDGQFIRAYQRRVVAPGYATDANYSGPGVNFDLKKLAVFHIIPRMGSEQVVYDAYCTDRPPAK
jgi:hypothetical protein